MSLVIPEKFQHILRIMNTNIDGKRKVGIAMTAIKGVGRRYSNIVLKKADVDLTKRAGECTEEEVDKVVTIISNPLQYKVPNWFLNRQKDIIDGKYWQLTSSNLDSKLRDDLERLKKIRSHRGLRHYWGLRVRCQHTKTTGEIVDDHRSGKIVVNLTGRLNKCGVISPRFDVPINDIEKWTNNLLPSRQFGYVVLTTSGGIMDHEEARRKHLGGKILGFFF